MFLFPFPLFSLRNHHNPAQDITIFIEDGTDITELPNVAPFRYDTQGLSASKVYNYYTICEDLDGSGGEVWGTNTVNHACSGSSSNTAFTIGKLSSTFRLLSASYFLFFDNRIPFHIVIHFSFLLSLLNFLYQDMTVSRRIRLPLSSSWTLPVPPTVPTESISSSFSIWLKVHPL